MFVFGAGTISFSRYKESCRKWCVAARNLGRMVVIRPRYRESCRKGCVAALCHCFSCIRLSRYRFFFLKWCVAARNRCRPAVSRLRHREFRRKGCVVASYFCFFLYPAVAIQAFPLEKVYRCTEPWLNGSFPSATQGISQKRVCRCTEPLHKPLRRTAVRTERKVAFCFLLSEGRVRNCF